MLAVMKRSENDLRQAIALSPHEIHGRDSGGWTALHLSVNWPTGMLILIEAGADVDCVGTVVGRSLLDIGIGIDSVELLRILGEADCSFAKGSDSCQWYYLRTLELYDPRIIAREEYGHGPISHHGRSSLYSKLSTASTTMAQLLVIFIANRRERLCNLAFEKVPSSVLARLFPRKTDEPYIIDEKASRLAQELTSRGIAVPPALNPGKRGETGYHAISGRPELAEILWNAGFRDVNGRDSCNMTPLMCCPIETLLRFIDWCLGKGFALNLDIEQDRAWYSGNADELDGLRPGQPLETESVYCKIYALGSLEKYHRSAQKPFVDMLVSCETDRPIAQKIFMASPTDSCICACSISGCTTRTFLFKGFNDLRGRPCSGYLTTRDMIKFYSDFEDVCSSLDAAEYLRLITFERLGLTHTCCRPHWARHSQKSHICIGREQRNTVQFSRPMSLSEIEEIRDEELADLQKLAELLVEFEAKVVELDLPIPDFISQYWEPRMEQVLQENEGSLDKETLRELGMKIYSSEGTADL